MSHLGLACAVSAGIINSIIPYVFRRHAPGIEGQAGIHIVGSLVAGGAAAVVMAAAGLPLGGAPFVLISAASGVLIVTNNFTYFSVVTHRGPMSISWAVVWMSAVGLAVLGWVFLGEPVLWGQPFGLVCFVGCLAAMGAASHRTATLRGGEMAPKRGYWFWLMTALACGTMGNLLMKLKDLTAERGHSLSFAVVRCAVGATLLAGFCRARGTRPDLSRRTWRLGAAFGALLLASMVLILEGLKLLDVSVIFPVTAGSAILSGMLLAILSGERPSRLAYAGAALAVLAIVLVNLGGPVLPR